MSAVQRGQTRSTHLELRAPRGFLFFDGGGAEVSTSTKRSSPCVQNEVSTIDSVELEDDGAFDMLDADDEVAFCEPPESNL